MKKLLGTFFVASAAVVAFAGCSQNGNTAAGSNVPPEERVKVAEDQVGIDTPTTYWKCVGKLDDDRYVAVAFQYDFVKGTMLSVNKTNFSAGSAQTDSVLVQHVSSYVLKSNHKLQVALPVTSEKLPEGTLLMTYNDKDETLEFHQDLTGDRLTMISCRDQKTTIQQ
jgi:hypothetical protein